MRLRLLSMLIALPLAGAVTTAWPADSVLPTEPKKTPRSVAARTDQRGDGRSDPSA